jgi:protein YibB
MSEITIITAFFDIGRGDFSHLKRSNISYVEYFKFWARMRNRLIVYTTVEFAKIVKLIRTEFGLSDRTTIVIIDDIFAKEKMLFQKMEEVSQNQNFRKFRFHPNALENEAKYNYVMLMKYWCMADAVENNLANGTLAWMDFGMNHGGSLYANALEFDFLWESPFVNDKIHLFGLTTMENICVANLLASLAVCITGYQFIVPDYHCKTLWLLVKQAMNSLISLDCIDDDQMLLTMAYRTKPELFEIHVCDWFMALKISGGVHLSIRDHAQSRNYIIGALKLKRFEIIKWIELLKYGINTTMRMRELRKLQ